MLSSDFRTLEQVLSRLSDVCSEVESDKKKLSVIRGTVQSPS